MLGFGACHVAVVGDVAVRTCPAVGALDAETFTVVVAEKRPFAVTLLVFEVMVLLVRVCVALTVTMVSDVSGRVYTREAVNTPSSVLV
jgi:hypothetical protein